MDLPDAKSLGAYCQNNYNHWRPRSSLGHLTPAAFAAKTNSDLAALRPDSRGFSPPQGDSGKCSQESDSHYGWQINRGRVSNAHSEPQCFSTVNAISAHRPSANRSPSRRRLLATSWRSGIKRKGRSTKRLYRQHDIRDRDDQVGCGRMQVGAGLCRRAQRVAELRHD